MNKLITSLVATIFAASTAVAFAQAPAKSDAPKAAPATPAAPASPLVTNDRLFHSPARPSFVSQAHQEIGVAADSHHNDVS